jgi:flagellar biosynthetic protein FlhB
MASEEGFEERTEDASQKKRDDWRKEGKVAQSKELVSSILLLAVTGSIYGGSHLFLPALAKLFEASLAEITKSAMYDWTPAIVPAMAGFVFKAFAIIMAPIAGTALLAGVGAHVAQFGFVWTSKSMEPSLDKLSPMNGLQRMFSMDGFFEFFKAGIKFIIVGVVGYAVVKGQLGQAGNLWSLEAPALAVFLSKSLIHVLFVIGIAMFILSAADFGFQKFRYETRIKMTKQEVREERKQMDGNPQVRARIRGLQRKFATNKMLEAVKKADVVVTNPTHFAVALKWDRDNMAAPQVVAKGVDHMAQRIKAVARENGVPCVENVPLARALYKALKIGQLISRDLYNAVAEVLAYVYRLKGRTQ